MNGATFQNGLYADERYPMLHGKCRNMLRRLQAKYEAALEKVDILVMPTTPWVAKVMPVSTRLYF
jgi:amidase